MPNSITVKAPAKINLTLDVIGKRPNGYHDLKMIMQTIDLHDELDVSLTRDKEISLEMNKELPDNLPPEKNLVYKAAQIMQDTFSISNGFHIDLTKNIPAAAGLAGGSSDCAATLLAINELCELQLTKEELCEIGVTLGADVPFCIRKGTMLCEGIGEILTPLPDIPVLWTLLIKPNISVSTAEVYSNLNLNRIYFHPNTKAAIDAITHRDAIALSGQLTNVLETVTFSMHPELADLKEFMLQNGALGALMSGSGPTIFGLFRDKMLATIAQKCALAKYPDYTIIMCQTGIPM